MAGLTPWCGARYRCVEGHRRGDNALWTSPDLLCPEDTGCTLCQYSTARQGVDDEFNIDGILGSNDSPCALTNLIVGREQVCGPARRDARHLNDRAWLCWMLGHARAASRLLSRSPVPLAEVGVVARPRASKFHFEGCGPTTDIV